MDILDDSIFEEIIDYTEEQLPKEACGLLAIEKGRVKFFKCENKAENPLNDFLIDPYDYKSVADIADVVAVIHSHPYEVPNPSIMDRAACNRLGIPWYIFGKEGMWLKLEPEEETFNLLGRPFVFGVYDCYTIVKDYFEDKGIDFSPEWDYEWEFWKKGKNLYMERFEKEGFFRVTDNSLQPHDVMLMALNSDIVNHAGIYVGKFKMLHHAPSRLSCRDNYNGMWKKITRAIIRHENFK